MFSGNDEAGNGWRFLGRDMKDHSGSADSKIFVRGESSVLNHQYQKFHNNLHRWVSSDKFGQAISTDYFR